jgi:hypothetical protein
LVVTIPFIFLVNSENRLRNRSLAAAYIAVVAGSALTLLSPGSVSRFAVEASRYMPQIADMNILQKALIGVDRLVESILWQKHMLYSINPYLSWFYLQGRKE